MRRGKTNPPAAAAPPNQQNEPTSQALERGLNSLEKKATELSNVPGANNAVLWSEVPPRARDILMQWYERARGSGKVKQTSGVEDFHGKKRAKPDAGSAAVHDQTTQSWPEEETTWCDKLEQLAKELSKEELKAFINNLEQALRAVRAAINDILQCRPCPQEGASETD